MIIRALSESDSIALSGLLTGLTQREIEFFHPFPFEVSFVQKMLKDAKDDRYWGIWVGNELAAVFMLRGMDEGYEIPSYGVAVDSEFRGAGLLKLSLEFSISWCALNGKQRLMLKVHPENTIAKLTYEKFGFVQDRIEAASGNLVYFRDVMVGETKGRNDRYHE
jgi:GNAT superfamily N-acetyltransferase